MLLHQGTFLEVCEALSIVYCLGVFLAQSGRVTEMQNSLLHDALDSSVQKSYVLHPYISQLSDW